MECDGYHGTGVRSVARATCCPGRPGSAGTTGSETHFPGASLPAHCARPGNTGTPVVPRPPGAAQRLPDSVRLGGFLEGRAPARPCFPDRRAERTGRSPSLQFPCSQVVRGNKAEGRFHATTRRTQRLSRKETGKHSFPGKRVPKCNLGTRKLPRQNAFTVRNTPVFSSNAADMEPYPPPVASMSR